MKFKIRRLYLCEGLEGYCTITGKVEGGLWLENAQKVLKWWRSLSV